MNEYNEQGQKHAWVDYYLSGKLRFKGNFINGKRHGPWERYYTNGKLNYKGNYVNGKQHGLWERYGANGELYEIRYYIR